MKKQINTITSRVLQIVFLLLFFNFAKAQVKYEQTLEGIEDGVGFLLSWSTVEDLDTDFFVVERSTDGLSFKSIGTLQGKRSKELAEYRFKDLELGLAKASYRLKEIAKDGRSSYSEAIVMTKEFVSYFEVVNKQKISAEVFQVSINSAMDGELECRVSNNMGEILTEERRTIEVGLNDFIYDLSNENDGTYHFIFKQNNVIETVVFKKEGKEKKGNVAEKSTEKRGG